MGEHEFVTFGIEAEGEVDEAIFFFRFTNQSAAVFLDHFDAFLDVVALEADSGPCSFALAASVNADGGTTKGDFAPDLHLKGKIGPKGVLVEFDGAKMVGRPDGVFHFLDLHNRSLTLLRQVDKTGCL